ncbi:MAG: metallophosphoesterase [Myxococcales bacterium]|nr:metallophosphoesterase [Myxococcales bacterium]
MLSLVGCQTPRLVLDAPDRDPALFHEAPDLAPEADEVTFAAVGDAGYVGPARATVAASIRRVCEGVCDFVIHLGDNLYPAGVADDADADRLRCILDSYGSTPTYAILGNHDYGALVPTLERARAELQLLSELPRATGGHFFRFDAGPTRLVALDTNLLVRGRPTAAGYDALTRWLRGARSPSLPWSVAFGHHPVVSNGSHRSAGGYRDIGLELWKGQFLSHVLRTHVLPRVDLYLSGHEHNLQMLVASPSTLQVVSGSASKCNSPPRQRPQPALLERYGYGFALIHATRERLEVTIHDAWGEPIFGAHRERGAASWESDPPVRSGHDGCGEELGRMATVVDPCSERFRDVAQP